MHNQSEGNHEQSLDTPDELLKAMRQELFQQHFAEELRDALLVGVMTGTIISPVKHTQLLEMTLETAARIIKAEYGVLCILDEEAQELIFEVVLGGAGKEMKQSRMPASQGIAGHVAKTRQPMIVNDTANNSLWNRQFSQQVHLIPRNIICVPMLRDERLVGVFEVCNKVDGGLFTDEDIEILGLFANQAAVAVELSRSHQTVTALVAEILESCSNIPKEQKEQLRQQAFRLTKFTTDDPEYRQRLELAQLIQAIAWRGEDELRVCQSILRSFADYLAA